MKTIAYFRYLALFLAVFALSACHDESSFSTLDGTKHQISDFNGRWLVVNFWAEWCAPCREEVPELNRLSRQRGEHKIAVLGVSYDRLSHAAISKIAREWGIEYPLVATEPMPLLPFSLPQRLPTTYLLNPQGEVVYRFEGKLTAQAVYEQIKQTVKSR